MARETYKDLLILQQIDYETKILIGLIKALKTIIENPIQ